MTQVYHTYVQIYTSFQQSDKLPHLVKLLYQFARSHDKQSFVAKHRKGEKGKGAGIVTLSVATLANTFNRSIATIKKNLRLALKLGVFWMLEIKGDQVRLVYSAFSKLCSRLGISNLGAIHEEKATNLVNVRSLNIKATVAQKQRNAHQACLRSTKEENRKNKKKKIAKRVVSPNKLFRTTSILSDRLTRKGKVSGVKSAGKLRGRFLLANRQFAAYGVSQEAIASLVDRTPQTIRKHLKDVNKYQVCVPSNDPINTPEFWLNHNLGEKQYLKFEGQLYTARTNIYDLEDESKLLLGCKGLRKRISSVTRKSQITPIPLCPRRLKKPLLFVPVFSEIYMK